MAVEGEAVIGDLAVTHREQLGAGQRAERLNVGADAISARYANSSGAAVAAPV
jgi:hypothetical protein